MSTDTEPWAVRSAMVFGSLQQAYWTGDYAKARFYVAWLLDLVEEIEDIHAEAMETEATTK